MRYQVGICDDDKETCRILEDYTERFFRNNRNSADVYVWYDEETCAKDLNVNVKLNFLFLDIELPGKNGITLGKYIRESMNNYEMQIIFVSSKTNYAMELFQVHPYDFLIKPINYNMVSDMFHKLLIVNDNDQRFFKYSFNKVRNMIPYGSIVYLESRGRKIYIKCEDGSEKYFNGKLKDEIGKLSEEFVMINQSYIINLKYMISCSYNRVMIINNQEFAIGAKYKDDFRKGMQQYTNFFWGG